MMQYLSIFCKKWINGDSISWLFMPKIFCKLSWDWKALLSRVSFWIQIESIIKLWRFISIGDLIKYQKPIVNIALIFFSKLTVKNSTSLHHRPRDKGDTAVW